jgi:hypothetical protein
MSDTEEIAKGLLSGTLPDGGPCIYFGGVRRIPDPHGPIDEPAYVEEFAAMASEGYTALASRTDYEPIDAASIELTGCWDSVTGDVILMWRVACVEVEKHRTIPISDKEL